MDVLIWIIELGVGAGCMVGGLATTRSTRLRVVGVLLTVAGVVAAVHAIASLTSVEPFD